jgi:hypothetical protein
MTSFGDILTVLGAGAGIAVLLIMVAVPLMTDHHRPQEQAERAEQVPPPPRPVVAVPAQRGPSDLRLRSRTGAAHAAVPRA